MYVTTLRQGLSPLTETARPVSVTWQRPFGQFGQSGNGAGLASLVGRALLTFGLALAGSYTALWIWHRR